MVRSEFTFLSADGVTQLHAVQWLPESGVRAVLQLVHGVAEYIMRYEPFAAFLTAGWVISSWQSVSRVITRSTLPSTAGMGRS